jgi:hypothetical protein
MTLCRCVVTIVVVMVCVQAHVATAAEVTLMTGERFSANILGMQSGQVRFNQAGIEKSLDYRRINRIDWADARPMTPHTLDIIELTDGSTLKSTETKIKSDEVVLKLTATTAGKEPQAQVKLDQLRAIIRRGQLPEVRAAWDELSRQPGQRDAFVIQQQQAFNVIAGSVIRGNDAGDAVIFESEDGQQKPIKLIRASGGLLLRRAKVALTAGECFKFVDQAGNQLLAKSMQWLEANAVEVTTANGSKVRYTNESLVVSVDFTISNLVYLSDLSAKLEPLLPTDPKDTISLIPLMRDRTLDGAPLRTAERVYRKGLLLAAGHSATYAIDGSFAEFRATAGIDDQTQSLGSHLTLTIELDGRVTTTHDIKPGTPVPVKVVLGNARTLKVTVTTQTIFQGDRVILGDAAFIK